MNILFKLLTLPVARAAVLPNLMPKTARMIEIEIKVGFPATYSILPKSLYSRLAQEAYRRAAEMEEDKIARNWNLCSQAEVIAKSVGLLCSGNNADDPILKNILLHNGVELP